MDFNHLSKEAFEVAMLMSLGNSVSHNLHGFTPGGDVPSSGVIFGEGGEKIQVASNTLKSIESADISLFTYENNAREGWKTIIPMQIRHDVRRALLAHAMSLPGTEVEKPSEFMSRISSMQTMFDATTQQQWFVEPFLVPEREDDPMGVYKVQPVADRLGKLYDETDSEVDDAFQAVHAENVANCEFIAASHKMMPEMLLSIQGTHSILESWRDCRVSPAEAMESLSALFDISRSPEPNTGPMRASRRKMK